MKMRTNRLRTLTAVELLMATALAPGIIAKAQSVQVQGVINSRSGSSMTLQTNSENVTVLLTPDTQSIR